MSFKQKYGPWALIAGASEGLGAAYAEALAKRGLNLILLARRALLLEKLAASLESQYRIQVEFYSVDLADLAKTKNLIQGIEQDVGLFIFNAAYAPIGYFVDVEEVELLKIIDVNVKAPLVLSKILVPEMIKRKRGGIILMSSLAGTQGSPKIATYAASKAFNTILAEGLWGELKESGIDVLTSCAGAIRTPGYQKAKDLKEAPGTLDPNQVAERTLKALGKGPVVVPGRINQFARFLMGRLLPRRTAISLMKQNTKDLS